jgi:hypothetical protein
LWLDGNWRLEVTMATTHRDAQASPGSRAVPFTLVAIGALMAAGLAFGAQGCHKAAVTDVATAPVASPSAALAVPAATSDHAMAKHAPRRREDVNRKELETTLPKGAPIEITAPEGDDEAFQLAQEIRRFLRSEKYPVNDVRRRAPDPSAKGVGLEPLPDGKWRVIVGVAE